MMNIRKLIKEEVAKALTCDHDPQAMRKSIPFEYDIQMLRDTQHKSSFHIGNKPMNARDMGLDEKRLYVNSVDMHVKKRGDDMTERGRDYNKFMEDSKFGAGGPLVRSEMSPAPRADGILYGSIHHHFNVKAMFEDANGNFVFKISLKDKRVDEDKAKHDEYIPGGLASQKRLSDIANMHDVPIAALIKQLKKGIEVEMEHTTDELVAMEIAKDHLAEDPIYYDKLEVMERPEFENSMGVSAFNPPLASLMEKRMDRILKEVNAVFGTNYQVKTMYPEQFGQVYIIRSGMLDENGVPVKEGGLMNFTDEAEKITRMVGHMKAMSGVDDGSPWRDIMDSSDIQPYRTAVVGKSHQNV